ncbi:unnamed protein product [Lasius platythorax]|uniref:Uncharacterized protein n=1 Tax=Lasius platythorax TaxID=488582 RepID=A0AAV2NE23_9HYME
MHWMPRRTASSPISKYTQIPANIYRRIRKECVGQVRVSCENFGWEAEGRECDRRGSNSAMPNRTPGVPGVSRGLFSIAVSPSAGAPGGGSSGIFSDRSTACGTPPRRFDTARNKDVYRTARTESFSQSLGRKLTRKGCAIARERGGSSLPCEKRNTRRK